MSKRRLQIQNKPRTVQPGVAFPDIIEQPLTPDVALLQLGGGLEQRLSLYRMGELFVMLGFEPGAGWHMSVSHPRRLPTWDELAHLRYRLIPDEVTMALLLPPHAEYVNIHDNCLHMHQIAQEQPA